jgi:chromate transporter
MSPAPPSAAPAKRGGLAAFVRYFLYLGSLGFGGPVALAGFMHRDLVEQRRWISEEDYRLGMALAQIMPGPLAAQLAIALGYFSHGVIGATAVGLAFVIPSFFMVVAISMAYVRFGGLWWMQALFYGIGGRRTNATRCCGRSSERWCLSRCGPRLSSRNSSSSPDSWCCSREPVRGGGRQWQPCSGA